jgi:AraC-like DNA-binding protein
MSLTSPDPYHLQLNNLIYSCVDTKQRSNEQVVTEHSVGYIIAGEIRFQTAAGTVVLEEGTIGMIRRNQLARSVKVPPARGGDFKSINIFLTREFLSKYAAENKIPPVAKYSGSPMVQLSPDPFLQGYFDSLMPYFNFDAPTSDNLADIKTKEAVELIIRRGPDFRDFLFDFSDPYKIDLEAYMNQNFMFNISTLQFAKLTGRSLASFKRDFEKIFNASPGQWLQQKRLAEALYQIRDKGRKPSEVYLDVGFENLSHFSYTFKKAFGVAPSMV